MRLKTLRFIIWKNHHSKLIMRFKRSKRSKLLQEMILQEKSFSKFLDQLFWVTLKKSVKTKILC